MSRHSGGMVADKHAGAPNGVPETQPVTSSASPATPKVVPQNVEVVLKPTRRRFTAKFKRGILKKLKACNGDGDVGKLLRQNGLYSSYVTAWQREVAQRELAALEPRQRGPKKKLAESDREVAVLRRENLQLRARAERAELLVEIQKKVSLLLNIPLPPTESGHS